MINANEARIVTNENEYKNILRAEEARLAAIRAIEEEKQRYLKMVNEIFEPIGEAIAQRAAEGYSNLDISVYNSTYTSKSSYAYNVNATNFYEYAKSYASVNAYVRLLTKEIVNYFEENGYRVVTKLPDFGYREIGKITLHW